MQKLNFLLTGMALLVLSSNAYSQALAATAKDLTPKCKTSTTKGDSACWFKISKHENCYVWNQYPQTEEKVTWTGQCKAGVIDGIGTSQWTFSGNGKSATGTYVDGKQHGEWELRFAYEDVYRGPFVDGKEHGEWEIRLANGSVFRGPFVDGKEHGEWEYRYATGEVHGGPFVDGKRHGEWEFRYSDGSTKTVIYRNGELQ